MIELQGALPAPSPTPKMSHDMPRPQITIVTKPDYINNSCKASDFVGVAMSGSAVNRRVHVVARTRPTANFAHGMIQLEEDGKVGG